MSIPPAGATLCHVLTSDDMRLIDVDSAYLALLGATRAQVIGRTTLALTHWQDRSRNSQLLGALRRSDTPFALRKRNVRIDGPLVWVEDQVSLFRDGVGGDRFITSIRRLDASEGRTAEASDPTNRSTGARAAHFLEQAAQTQQRATTLRTLSAEAIARSRALISRER